MVSFDWGTTGYGYISDIPWEQGCMYVIVVTYAIRDLPDMYARSSKAMHTRQIMYILLIMYHNWHFHGLTLFI